MNPGMLNKRVSILEQVSTSNSFGETLNNWVEIKTVWAHIKPLQGRELFLAQQVHTKITTKIIIRYQPNILPNMKIKYKDRDLEIDSVINVDEQSRFLELVCKEVI